MSSTAGVYAQLSELLAARYLAQAIDLRNSRHRSALLTGLHKSRARGRGMDFDEVRLYQPGDDVKRIDWRVTARTQKPHTKLYSEERERPVMLLVDQSRSLFFGSRTCFKSTLATKLAATLAWSSLLRGDRVGGIVFSDTTQQDIRPRRHKKAALSLIEALLKANHALSKTQAFTSENYLLHTLTQAQRTLRPGGLLILISDFSTYNSACYHVLHDISKHTQVMGIFIYDVLEKELPERGKYTISNGEQRITFNSAINSLRNNYQQQFVDHLAQIKTDLTKCDAPLLIFSTTDNLTSELQRQIDWHKKRLHR